MMSSSCYTCPLHVKSNKFQALKQEITLTKFCQIWFLLLHVGGFKLYMGNVAQIMTVSEMIIYMWVNKKTRGILFKFQFHIF